MKGSFSGSALKTAKGTPRIRTHPRLRMNDGFSPDEHARARAYHRPLYLALLLDLALAAGLLEALAWSSLGSWVVSALDAPWPVVAAAASPALVAVISSVLRMPLSLWRGSWRERSWGVS